MSIGCPVLLPHGTASAGPRAVTSPADSREQGSSGPVSGNPAATTFPTGIGWLGRALGIPDEWGIVLGGFWLADANIVAAGGAQPGNLGFNSVVSVGLTVDADKLAGWRGGSFGVLFTQYDGEDVNVQAGSVMGYNGVGSVAPYHRTELNEAWYLQSIVKDRLQVRIGRVLPINDFNNVLRPVTLRDEQQNIASVSGLLYTPVFINPTLLGFIPGYYNPADGVTVNFTPTSQFYVNLGFYDGNNARGVQSAFNGPTFNNYRFNIAEAGINWLIGEGQHPGQAAIGTWRQTGMLQSPNGISQNGAGGIYLFGSQRVAYGVNALVPKSSVSVFFQLGSNDSATLPVNRYYGAGVTGFGLIGRRDRDSIGVGVAFSELNPALLDRPSELMIQGYYQAHLYASTYLQPTVSYVPTPGVSSSVPGALAATLRLTVLF
ncbi:MAG: carbohydrate porin [Reyranellales bacterium]